MKTTMRTLARDEKGAALLLAIILLLVGGLIAAPLLAYMGSGIITGEVYETRTAELYAADAGVEDAMWKIQHQDQVPEVKALTQCYQDWSYNITDGEGEVAEVNDRRVEVTITLVNNLTSTYRVLSTATGDGSGTRVEAYVTGASVSDDYSGILNGILTSQGLLDWKNKVTLNYTEGHGPAANYTGAWPDEPKEIDKFAQFYWMDVKDEPEFGSGIVDLAGVDKDLGPVYRDGELEILNSSPHEATLSLNGTIYVTEDTLIGTNGHDFILDLNGQTIFVESNSVDPEKALWMGGKCTLKGPGCIIAVGDVYFEPNPDVGGEGEPVFAFSVLGTTTVRPGVSMYGALAGRVQVGLQAGSKPQINYPVGGFEGLVNFPGFIETKLVYSIASWEATPLALDEG